jgi:hypothetical protein
MKILNTNIKIFFSFNFKIDEYLDLFLMDEFEIDILHNFNIFISDFHYNKVFFM